MDHTHNLVTLMYPTKLLITIISMVVNLKNIIENCWEMHLQVCQKIDIFLCQNNFSQLIFFWGIPPFFQVNLIFYTYNESNTQIKPNNMKVQSYTKVFKKKLAKKWKYDSNWTFRNVSCILNGNIDTAYQIFDNFFLNDGKPQILKTIEKQGVYNNTHKRLYYMNAKRKFQ